ncbi:hypothetical protein [Streptomyces sp. B6B3]|uniref:hypothetical protein n=1 Tax=Streptomyces sp. B6B3 TaxID=3153570 RepID=UPI00325E7D63
MPVSIAVVFPEGRIMSSSRRRRALLAPLVSLVAAAVLGALAGCSTQAPAGPADGDPVSAPPSPDESLTPPEPDATGLTQASPDQGVTEESPTPSATEPDDPDASDEGAEASEPPATAPDPTETAAPDPTDGADPGEEEAMEQLCAMGEPYDWWGDASIRQMCEDEYGY